MGKCFWQVGNTLLRSSGKGDKKSRMAPWLIKAGTAQALMRRRQAALFASSF